METKLLRIAQLSAENPDMVFTSLGHLINYEMLKDCSNSMDGNKAVGIDGITKEEYESNLDENLIVCLFRLCIWAAIRKTSSKNIFFVLVFSYKEKRLEQDAPTSDDFAF